MTWHEQFAKNRLSVAQAIERIPKGKHIFISSGACEPELLVNELVAQASRFAGNTIVHLLTLGSAPYVNEQYQDRFRHNAFFIGANVRKAVHEGRADYTPVFLSQIPGLIRSRRMPVDVALVQVSPPDEFGFVNLGVSVDIVKPALEAARLVIAQINPRMPVVYGAGFIHMRDIQHWVLGEHELPELQPQPLDDVALEIGRNVAALIDDRATIQVGIGQIPDAVLKALDHKKDLGVWTEMFSDGVVDLIENGNVTGKFKTIHPQKVSSSFSFGSRRIYDYVNRNPMFTFHPSDYINNPVNIAQQHCMVAINSALQIDLTGQVCADSIGTKFYSGIGGQVDFIRGASMCPGGKPIIAIRSTAKKGTVSRITASLDQGAGVVTSRGDVRFVVTEYGVADLQGKSIRERAMSLISITHPDFRAELLENAKHRHYVFTDQIAPRAEYPKSFETTLDSKKKGPVLMRPIRVTDEPKLKDLFYNLSKQTIYRRFAQVREEISHVELLKHVDIDYAKNMAIVIETAGTKTEPELVGVGRYHVNQASSWAEVALVVRDDWQHQGLGTALMTHLIQAARENGVDGFTAEVLAENHDMMHVFHKSGLEVQSTLQHGIHTVRMPVNPRGRRRKTDDGRK